MKKIIRYVWADLVRNRIVLGYTALLLIMALSVFSLEDNPSKGVLSLLNVILIMVPLVSIVFSTIYVYNSTEFIELLVSQPLRRRTIWSSLFTGLAGALVAAFLLGAGIPLLLYHPGATGWIMLTMGVLLTLIFVAIAVLSAVWTRDKARGIGKAILLWLYFSLLFDGLVLFMLFQFADYPVEKWMVATSALNPIDLARVMVLLHLDESAMMGYTGAIFREFFGTRTGLGISFTVLAAWAIIPVWISLRTFNRKDL